ncbi:MAG: dTMP kinase [Clostridiales Family XIII bacterium]|jgi:dTMP kinase|nr:dTMP kinase [Clostridiales Family XIII bacterium]
MKQTETRGKFIALEGIDGSGKSTQARLLADRLLADGLAVHATFEPTRGDIGALLRRHLTGELRADERVVAALFAADRLDHLLNEADGLAGKIEGGVNVISDRYYFSSYAYHSLSVPMDWVIAANALSAGLVRPDVNIFIDTDPEACMQRIAAGRQDTEKYEQLDVLRRVREKYYEAFDRLAGEETVAIVDGDRPEAAVAQDILGIARRVL